MYQYFAKTDIGDIIPYIFRVPKLGVLLIIAAFAACTAVTGWQWGQGTGGSQFRYNCTPVLQNSAAGHHQSIDH